MTDLVAAALGNTSAALAAVQGTRPGEVLRVPIAEIEDLKDGFARVAPGDGGAEVPIVVVSVHPPALERFRRLAANVAQKLPEVAGVDFPIPVAADVDEPARVGPDRLLACLAAYRRAGGPCVVVDAGTAVTVNAVDPEGTFLGGAILPGARLQTVALSRGTVGLPEIAYRPPDAVIGRDTEEAIRSGVGWGVQGGVSYVAAATAGALIHRYPDAARPTVFLTGGGADDVERLLEDLVARSRGADPDHPGDPFVRRVPDLVLEGLVIAYRQWQER